MKENEKEQLIERTEVENTPFVIITKKDEGSFIAMGRYRISEVMETPEECTKMVNEKPWMMILSVINLMVDDAIESNNERQKHYENARALQKEKENGNN